MGRGRERVSVALLFSLASLALVARRDLLRYPQMESGHRTDRPFFVRPSISDEESGTFVQIWPLSRTKAPRGAGEGGREGGGKVIPTPHPPAAAIVDDRPTDPRLDTFPLILQLVVEKYH